MRYSLVTFTSFILVFFFFKQKTAYEMRISDWSSDVCSSDLVAAQWIVWQGAVGAERCERVAQASGRIARPRRWNQEVGAQLAVALGRVHQRLLMARFGDAGHRAHAVLVVLPAQVGDTVLVDAGVAQVARGGAVAVVPADVRSCAIARLARGAQQPHRTRVGQRVRHPHERLLAADAWHHAPIVDMRRGAWREKGCAYG